MIERYLRRFADIFSSKLNFLQLMRFSANRKHENIYGSDFKTFDAQYGQVADRVF